MSRSYCPWCKGVGRKVTFRTKVGRLRHQRKCVNAPKPDLFVAKLTEEELKKSSFDGGVYPGQIIDAQSPIPRYPYAEICCVQCGQAMEILFDEERTVKVVSRRKTLKVEANSL